MYFGRKIRWLSGEAARETLLSSGVRNVLRKPTMASRMGSPGKARCPELVAAEGGQPSSGKRLVARVVKTEGMVTFCVALALQAEMDRPLPAGTAVEFSAQTLAGAEVKSSSLKGAPSVVILWGSWSQPSVRALEIGPVITKEFPRVKVVALASGDDRDSAAKAATAANLELTFWWDPAGRDRANLIATTVFKTRRFPTIYVMDSQVKVVAGFLGYKSTDRDALFAAIRGAN